MCNSKYIGYLLYRAYIDRHPEVKCQLQLCGQAHLGLAFNLPGVSPITGLIISFLEPESIIYLILKDNYSLIIDPLFSHIIHLNNMITELTPHLRCKFCPNKPVVGAGCEHYKLDCNLGWLERRAYINYSDPMKHLIHRYYSNGEDWRLDWEVYITIGNIIQDNGRAKSWSLRNHDIYHDHRLNCTTNSIIQQYFYTYYFWWSADDYDTFIKTCSKLMV